jgi:signal transduction histidine kinase
MRLKTKLVLAITALVLMISGVLSIVYVSQLLHASIQQSWETNHMIADQVKLALQQALQAGLDGVTVDPNNPEELRSVTSAAVRSSEPLQAAMLAANRYSLTVFDVVVVDAQGKTVVSTEPETQEKLFLARPEYKSLIDANSYKLMREVFGRPRVFDIIAPLERNGRPFLAVHVGVRTTFLRAVYGPWLEEAFTLMGFALGTSILVALLLSNVALRPLEQISHQLAYWTPPAEDAEPNDAPEPRQDTVVRVSHQIERMGQRMRNVEEVFSALKTNLDQILGNLEDGILLFTKDGRAVLVSEAARRFLQLDREQALGQHYTEIFDRGTLLGRTLREAFDARAALIGEEIRTENGRRLQASVDFILDDLTQQGLGALVTLRDLESVEAIESELEVSRRMSAIGRLTSGVAHEVKNPINAIVVHIELLRNKLDNTAPSAVRHLEVIEAEIRRLDRVVQTLVDFSRPVELQLREQDFRSVVGDVLALSKEEFSTRNVSLVSQMPPRPVTVNVDADLLKQAILNVIQNGAQAMPEGGKLQVQLEVDRKWAVLHIMDEGLGIPEDIREKIFDLYFTTKAEGSGIGLAMTYRILQLHHGNVEVESEVGVGTQFRFRLPIAVSDGGRRQLQPVEFKQEKGLKG